LASVALKLNDVQASESALKKAVALDTNASLAHLALAKLYIATKKFDLAHQSLDSVLAVDPSPDVIRLKSEVYAAEGKSEQAAELLKTLRSTQP